jgi:SAM-dependent methyltransferase
MSWTCPVCQNDRFQARRIAPFIAVQACSSCRLLVSQIQPPAVFHNEFERIRPEAYEASVGSVRRSQAREIVHWVQQRKPSGLWLDIGCSFGYLLTEARLHGYELRGIEPDDRAFQTALAQLGPQVVVQGLASEENLEDAGYDIISMLDVLEHIPVTVLPTFAAMLRRKLRPGGLLIIKVPTREGLFYKIAHALAPYTGSLLHGVLRRLWQSDYEFPHTVYFDQSSLRRYLEKSGYRWAEHRYLDEVPLQSVFDRLRMDKTLPWWQALCFVPGVLAISILERWRGKSDALCALVEARP